MNGDHYTEVTNTSWFAKIQKALGGIVIGIILVIAAMVGLFWNEGRAVRTERALDEGAGMVVSVDPAARNAGRDGALIHFTGLLVPQGVPADPIFSSLDVPKGSLRLVRTVEMYQWKQESRSETRKKLGGGDETVTTYHYAPDWSATPIHSADFKIPDGHQNPAFSLESETFPTASGTVGAFTLAGDDLTNLGKPVPLTLRDQDVRAARKALGTNRPATQSGGKIFVGVDPLSPRVGDLRIGFEIAKADRISVVGKQDGSRIAPFVTSNGTELLMLRDGDATAAAMFEDAQQGNTILTWGLRLGGLVAMLIGFNLILAVFGVLGDIIPLIGDILRFATGSLALMMTAVLGPLIIGIAWVTYRPLVGGAIIGGGLLIAGLALYRGRLRARSAATA